MTKIDIMKIELKKARCMICKMYPLVEYYSMYIEYTRDGIITTSSEYLCFNCHCALKKQFTGVD